MAGIAHHVNAFATRAALAQAFASTVAAKLGEAISARGEATIAVSGGTTPALFFAELAKHRIDWAKVTVTLVDERFVEPSSPRSNEGLVRRTLLQGPAMAGRFVPLYRSAPDVGDACRESSDALRDLSWPLDVVVLGMGSDGHTASFFPDADNLASLLDPATTEALCVVAAPSAVEPRLTLALPRIASARFLALHIEGDEKRAVLGDAIGGLTHPPIRTVIEYAAHPVQIYWAP